MQETKAWKEASCRSQLTRSEVCFQVEEEFLAERQLQEWGPLREWFQTEPAGSMLDKVHVSVCGIRCYTVYAYTHSVTGFSADIFSLTCADLCRYSVKLGLATGLGSPAHPEDGIVSTCNFLPMWTLLHSGDHGACC